MKGKIRGENMAKKGKSGNGEAHFSITQANLDAKGKTNKKIKLNAMAAKYLTPKGKELKEAAAAYAKEHYKKGRRYRKPESKLEEVEVVEVAS